MKKIKNLINTKPKKIAVIAIIIALLIIVSTCIGIGCRDKYYGTYESVISATCAEDYTFAKLFARSLPENYRDTDKILLFIDIVQNFDENDKNNYSHTLEQLEKIDSFDNKEMNEFFISFKNRISLLNEQYKNNQQNDK